MKNLLSFFGLLFLVGFILISCNETPSDSQTNETQQIAPAAPVTNPPPSDCGNVIIEDCDTGVLDWSGFLIGDPAIDIGNTLVLITIPFKHVAPTLGMDFSNVNFEQVAEVYLQAYQSEKQVDQTHLEYYRVNRCTNALMEGAQGQSVWQHPPIIRDLLEYIHSVTGISITMPKP